MKTKRGGVRKFREERRIMVERMPLRRRFLGALIQRVPGALVPEAEVVRVTKYVYIKSTTVYVPSSELGLF